MTDFLRWAVAIEVVGLAFLPLSVWLLGRLPDRGYAFAKVLGLLLVTYITWLVGSALPVAGSAVVPCVVILAAGAACWLLFRRQTTGTLWMSLRPVMPLVAVEEALFLAGLLAWSLLRVYAFHPGIAHTEQYMDMAFLQASYRSPSYPPYDPWMSGHTINYYYFGYLMFATLAKVSGVAPAVAYSLSLSAVFAWTVSLAYGLGYAFTRRFGWSLLAPVSICLLGNWHGVLWQMPHSNCAGAPAPGFWGWLWDSTRVVGGHFTLLDWACNHPARALTDYTINEYPLFSFVLGDLHPHVMGLPFTLLAIALGWDALHRTGAMSVRREPGTLARLLITAVALGALFTINSWDFPTYLLVVCGCIAAGAYISDLTAGWWRDPLVTCVALALSSLILYLPFYLRFRSLAHGVGLVRTPSDPFEFLQVFGFLLLACALLLSALGLLLRPVEDEEGAAETAVDRAPTPLGLADQSGSYTPSFGLLLALLAAIVLGALLHIWVLLLLLAGGAGTAVLLQRVLNTEEPNRNDAAVLILVGVACLILILTETIYLRDTFDGSAMYRMNTVFKFYYQAWLLLGLAAAYGAYRAWRIVDGLYGRRQAALMLGMVAFGMLGASVYTVKVPTYAVEDHDNRTLDGSVWLAQAQPDDYQAIQWLRAHVAGTPVELEAVGGDYDAFFARISTFTGLPTVMGWAGHEDQWRPGDPAIGRRVADVRTMYTSPDAWKVEGLLRKYGVRYVFLGAAERQAYGRGVDAAAFGRFMQPAFRSGRTTVYVW